ncbi:hypothetical protein GW17_00061196, partial [Ensete ventricosum]
RAAAAYARIRHVLVPYMKQKERNGKGAKEKERGGHLGTQNPACGLRRSEKHAPAARLPPDRGRKKRETGAEGGRRDCTGSVQATRDGGRAATATARETR